MNNNKNVKMIISVLLIALCSILFGACTGSKSENQFAKAEEIKLVPGRWAIEQDFLGLDYAIQKGGVLVTNTSVHNTKITVKATFYDADSNFVDDDTRTITLKGKDSWFVFFNIGEDVTDIKYSATTDKAFWEPVSAVDIEYDFGDNKVTATNKSNRDFQDCCFQYVYFDESGKIIFCKSGSVNEGYVPAGERASGEIPSDWPSDISQIADVEIYTYCVYKD